MQTTLSQTWREITIDRKKIVDARRISNGRVQFVDHERSADECHTDADILKQIAEALEAGVRVLLVEIRDAEGGDIDAGEEVFRALRAFAANPVRRVIVHVSGFAASTAAHVALAGDYLLVDPDARFHLHGAIVSWPGDPEGEERARLTANARTSAAMRERSAMPELAIEAAMAARYDPTSDRPFKVMQLLPEMAVRWQWADMVADLDRARDLAAFLAHGGDVCTARTLMLRKRLYRPSAECTIDAARIDTISLAADHATIGGTTLDQAWFGRVHVMAGHGLRWNTPSTSQFLMSVDSGAKLAIGSWNDTTKKLRLLGVGLYAAGFERMIILSNRADTVSGGSLFSLRSSYSADHGVSGDDLYADVSLWATYWDGSAWVDAIQDWNNISTGMSAPVFDVVAVAFNSTSNWFYW